jgi:PAS domain S-box-containing protein
MEFMKMKLKDIHSDEDIEEIIEQVELKSNKLTTDGIWKHKNSAGKISYAEIISHKIDYDSKPARLVIATDITTSVIDREELQKEKQLLRTLIDHLPVAIYVKDIGARKIVANKFDLAIIGVESESEILGKTDLEIFTTEIGLRGYNDDMTVINTGNAIINREEVFTDKDGNEQLILTSKIPLFNQKGVPTGLIGIGRNITESKKANEAIVQERQLLRTLIDHLPDAIYVKDKNARKLVANATDLKIMNCASETDVIGKTDLEIFHSDYERKGYDEDTSILKTGLPILNKEDCYSDSDGKLHWRIISKLPLIDHNGNITGLVGIGHDITEQKNALQTIQKLSTSIEQSPSIIIITNTNGDIEYVNPSLTEITGFTPEETIGKKPNIFKSGLTPNETYDELWKTISSGEVWRGELYNRKKSGEYYWEWVIITSLKNELGDITNYIAIKEDITLRKEMEADLIIAKEKAEENDRLKSAFLANMSHEIRTPLNCILGFADLLSEPVYHSDQQQCIEYAQLIMASGNNLLAIINDIMDISKIEAGQVHVRMAEFNPNELLLSIWKEFEIKALEKQIDLILTTPNSPTIKYIESDETKIKQVLINFVGNAIKFTEKGSVVIGHEFKGDFVRFFISDTGIGIPKKFHENIFERFRQIENTSTRKYGGTGLGLAISKSLIELLGGKIGMESIPNEGSTFYFTLPINHKRSKQIRV